MMTQYKIMYSELLNNNIKKQQNFFTSNIQETNNLINKLVLETNKQITHNIDDFNYPMDDEYYYNGGKKILYAENSHINKIWKLNIEEIEQNR